MKFEARNTIMVGIGLIVYGMAALLWQRGNLREWSTSWRDSAQARFAKTRRQEMMQGEDDASPCGD